MWVLKRKATNKPEYFKAMRNGKAVNCDAASAARLFSSRSAAEGTARFLDLNNYEVTTIWG